MKRGGMTTSPAEIRRALLNMKSGVTPRALPLAE
jgi:hypothetical protein